MKETILQDVQIQLLRIAQAVDSGQGKAELLQLVAEAIDFINQKGPVDHTR